MPMLWIFQPTGQQIGVKYSKNANNTAWNPGGPDRRWRFTEGSSNPRYSTKVGSDNQPVIINLSDMKTALITAKL